ncbi:hypothetical protein PoB_006063300 [Plakobranchus ocellatus]|uniref:Uncharacterized protein n=1 Tax=Plakobranchus ocellatus TaxID=259542 RepID=A0AAV4CQG9_9GAST|nr:hypothetical protein PoB_006063300 [Plakobranchus ocellatus]
MAVLRRRKCQLTVHYFYRINMIYFNHLFPVNHNHPKRVHSERVNLSESGGSFHEAISHHMRGSWFESHPCEDSFHRFSVSTSTEWAARSLNIRRQ